MRRLRSFDLADAKMGTALCPGLAFEGRAGVPERNFPPIH